MSWRLIKYQHIAVYLIPKISQVSFPHVNPDRPHSYPFLTGDTLMSASDVIIEFGETKREGLFTNRKEWTIKMPKDRKEWWEKYS